MAREGSVEEKLNDEGAIRSIDVVVTWVDGQEPGHLAKLNSYLNKEKESEEKEFEKRYVSLDEIEYCIRSIIKYAPFIGKIHIVTDAQRPGFLDQWDFDAHPEWPEVRLVDHQDIFAGFEEYLPVFNSISIETMLHRIPDLAEQFIYFNDDLFLTRPCESKDFFIEGRPVIRGYYDRFDEDVKVKVVHQKLLKTIGKPTKDQLFGYKKAQQNAARLLGRNYYFRLDHTAAPLRKSTLQRYFDAHPDQLVANISHRFKAPNYFMIQSLANELELQNENCVVKPELELEHFDSYKMPEFVLRKRLRNALEGGEKLFLNLQSLSRCEPKKLEVIRGILDEVYALGE